MTSTDGLHRVHLTRSPRLGNWSPAWSPDGRLIAFASSRPGTDVWLMRANGRIVKRLTTGGGEYPAWSPDGRRLAFMSSRSGDYEIYVVDVDGTGLRRLTRNPTEDGWPAWSPDGKRIAFERAYGNREGLFDIYVMHSDGTGLRNLTRNRGDRSSNSPDWSPDGAYILFSGYRQRPGGAGGIFLMKSDGSGRRRLLDTGVSPVWQPRPLRRQGSRA